MMLLDSVNSLGRETREGSEGMWKGYRSWIYKAWDKDGGVYALRRIEGELAFDSCCWLANLDVANFSYSVRLPTSARVCHDSDREMVQSSSSKSDRGSGSVHD